MCRTYKYIAAMFLALMLALMQSCDVHEWPETEYGDVEFYLELDFDTALPFYREVIYSRGETTALDADIKALRAAHDYRYIIGVYPAGSVRGSRASRAPVSTFVFTKSSFSDLNHRVAVSLPEGEWDIYVWTDYVNSNSADDKYYLTDDFSNISYTSPSAYEGSNECREAFRGHVAVNVTHPYRFMEGETLPSYTAVVPMKRPMGRYEFISTDVEEFIKRLDILSSRGDATRGDIDSRSLSRADLEEFTVRFRYTAFMPSIYNVFSDKVIDSWTGITFESKMDVSDEGIIMGFDHVLVTENETIANVSCEVYNGAGQKIASTYSIEVPVARSKNTVVRGEFLTSNSSGGVTVVPGYNGDYNIEIQ